MTIRPEGSTVRIDGKLHFRPKGEENIVEYELSLWHPHANHMSVFRTSSWNCANDYRALGWACKPLTEEQTKCVYFYDEGKYEYQLSDLSVIQGHVDHSNDLAHLAVFPVAGGGTSLILNRESLMGMYILLGNLLNPYSKPPDKHESPALSSEQQPSCNTSDSTSTAA
jgi:hypothetical protein